MGQPSHLGDRKILVMYIFAATDPEFLDNLRFFISEAVEQDTLCEYVIVVQRYRDEEQVILKLLLALILFFILLIP